MIIKMDIWITQVLFFYLMEEFVMASTNYNLILTKSNIKKIFKMIDVVRGLYRTTREEFRLKTFSIISEKPILMRKFGIVC